MYLKKIPRDKKNSTRGYHIGNNDSLVIHRYGNVRVLAIFNLPQSIIKNISFDALDKVKGTIDCNIGWVWDGNTTSHAPVCARLTGYGITSLFITDSSGVIRDMNDGDGTIFGSITYIADV